MTLQILTLKLDGITASDYLTWCWDPDPPALDIALRSISHDADRSRRHDHRNPRLEPPRPTPAAAATATATAAGLPLPTAIEIQAPMPTGVPHTNGDPNFVRVLAPPPDGARRRPGQRRNADPKRALTAGLRSQGRDDQGEARR